MFPSEALGCGHHQAESSATPVDRESFKGVTSHSGGRDKACGRSWPRRNPLGILPLLPSLRPWKPLSRQLLLAAPNTSCIWLPDPDHCEKRQTKRNPGAAPALRDKKTQNMGEKKQGEIIHCHHDIMLISDSWQEVTSAIKTE